MFTKKTATGPCPDPYEFSPHLAALFL